MASVPITELKARLAHYLRMVQRGSEVQVLERGVPVARLVGLRGSSPKGKDQAKLERLAEAGILRPSRKNLSWLLDEPPLPLTGLDLRGALSDDREDRF